MKPAKRYPDIYVESSWLRNRPDVVKNVLMIGPGVYKVLLDHPIFGETIEIFELDESDGTLCLRSSYSPEMQSPDEVAAMLDYYNSIAGDETFLEYFQKDCGYFLISRNTNVYSPGGS